MERGLSRFNSDEGIYIDVLRSFALNTRSLLKSIQQVNENSLDAYATTVHGIKGSSRGIMALGVGDMAEELENAAKSGDMAYVTAHNQVFLDAAWKLICDLDDMISGIDTENKKPQREKPDEELLTNLRIACEAYDMDGIDELMTKLNEYAYESDGGLAIWLNENVKQMNFKEIVEKLG
jgi:HPt (histidine-containing phosphotransfer) domain-containing protein